MDAEDDTLIAGADYTVEAAGFIPGSTVEVELHSDPWSFGTWIANAYGRITARIQVPPTTLQGQHRLVVREHITVAQAMTRSALQTEIPVSIAIDELPPSLGTVSVSPTAVDVTSGDASVTVTLTATDAGVGLLAGTVTYYSATCGAGLGTQLSLSWNDNDAGMTGMTLISGDRTNGTWQGTLVVPTGLPSCSIPLNDVALCDRVDNCVVVWAEDLGVEVPSISLTNSDAADLTNPSLTTVSVSPTAVDVTSGDASVTVTLTATDNLTGVLAGTVTYSGSTCGGADLSLSWNDNDADMTGMTLISGDRTNGTWQGTLVIPSGLSSCSIPLNDVALCDRVDNCVVVWAEDLGVEAESITITRSD